MTALGASSASGAQHRWTKPIAAAWAALDAGPVADVDGAGVQLLMALSNKFGAIVLTTGNKSEMATGYCTLYGDMAGGGGGRKAGAEARGGRRAPRRVPRQRRSPPPRPC